MRVVGGEETDRKSEERGTGLRPRWTGRATEGEKMPWTGERKKEQAYACVYVRVSTSARRNNARLIVLEDFLICEANLLFRTQPLHRLAAISSRQVRDLAYIMSRTPHSQ